MASENEYTNNLFFEMPDKNNNENENEIDNEKLSIALFQLINAELHDMLLNNEGSKSDDETDGPIQFIQNIIENVKRDFEVVVENGERKTFLHVFTKIFATLLSVKADNIEEIINLIKMSLSTVIKSWSEQNQFLKE